jgi:dTDP-4-amino-4,6-dideoxygalactose transaminase
MSDIMAALGLAQLRKLEDLRQRREAIAKRYTAAFADLPLRTPQLQFADNTHAWHLYILQLQLDHLTIDRDTFIQQLADVGIGTSVHFIPLHLHPYWQQRYGFRPMDFPVALEVYQRAVSLPIYPDLHKSDVERIIAQVRRILIAAQK